VTRCLHMDQDDGGKLRAFVDWLSARGATFEPLTLTRVSASSGFGAVANRRIGAGECIISLPRVLGMNYAAARQSVEIGEAIESTRGLDVWVDEAERRRFSVYLLLLHERRKGTRSAWAAYIDLLPVHVENGLWLAAHGHAAGHGPLLAALRVAGESGCDLLDSSVRDNARCAELHQAVVCSHLAAAYPALFGDTRCAFSVDALRWAHSIWWSRALRTPAAAPVRHARAPKSPQQQPNARMASAAPAFAVLPRRKRAKAETGVAGVVLATTLAALPGSAAMANRGKLVPFPPAAATIPLPRAAVASAEEGEALLPLVDILNHCPGMVTRWEGSQGCVPPGPAAAPALATDCGRAECRGEDAGSALRLVAARDIDTGTEVCLNYGAKGNRELLLYYGFVLHANPGDVCPIQLPAAYERALQQNRLSTRHLLFRVTDDDGEGESSNSAAVGCKRTLPGGGGSLLSQMPFSAALLDAARAMSLQDHLSASAVAEGGHADQVSRTWPEDAQVAAAYRSAVPGHLAWCDFGLPLKPSLEVQAMQGLSVLLEQRRAGLQQSILLLEKANAKLAEPDLTAQPRRDLSVTNASATSSAEMVHEYFLACAEIVARALQTVAVLRALALALAQA